MINLVDDIPRAECSFYLKSDRYVIREDIKSHITVVRLVSSFKFDVNVAESKRF